MTPEEHQPGHSADLSLDVVVRPLLRRIEKLTLTFLTKQFTSPADLWRFQVDLLRLQRDIQATIKRHKLHSNRDSGARDILLNLRACRWHSRRLGDLLAWVLLGGDKKLIEPLSRNARSHVTPADHGSRGMLIAASHLASQGWGFPLIHDVTGCLRVGDVTFVKAGGGSERKYNTVEIKTNPRFIRRCQAEGLSEYEYHIQIISAMSADEVAVDHVMTQVDEVEPVSSIQRRRFTQREGRQLKRMSNALLHQTAEPNVLIREDGQPPAVWTGVSPSTSSHWKPLQRVVRKARRSGYGSEIVDNTFLYCAFYSADGLSPASIDPVRLNEDLTNPALLVTDASLPNVLSMSYIPDIEETGLQLFRPFSLYPIPRTSIGDIIYGRMMIAVCFNEGRIVQSLREAGFEVEYDSTVNHSPFTITGSCAGSDGIEYGFRYADLRYYFDEMIYEFRGRGCLIDAAKTASEVIGKMTADLSAERRVAIGDEDN